MAKTSSRSLTSVGRSVARRVVGRGRSEAPDASTGTRATTAPAEAAAKKGSAKKAPAKKAPAKKAPAKKAPAKKTVAEKTPAKKTPAKKTAAKKAPAAKAPVEKTSVAKAPAKKQPAARKVSTKQAPAKKPPVAKKGAPNRVPAKAVPEKAPATSPAKAAPAARKGSLGALVVLPGESAWTRDELGEVRTHLRADVKRLALELEVAEDDLHDLMRDAGDGAGHDQADVGSTTFERDQEMMITNNAREMMEQSAHALERISDGSYGVCEGCTEAIGKMRLMAFPRATLCMTCKQREERR
ncbi:MAG: TraR/DksA C4-type zinc finger protein [Marmoricola sp.]